MRRFIVKVLAPVGDALATACLAVMLHGFAWIVISVYVLPGVPVVEDLAFVYGALAVLGLPLLISYLALLVGLALIYRVPLGPIFLCPSERGNILREAEA